jgi:hypothetical protein|tara:strand:+ start:380 stop:1207 length:828 start_codon:yes stop_codon:yes gene_type:complete
MKYVLALGIETILYKSPKIRISLDNRFIDEIHLEEDIKNRSVPANYRSYFNYPGKTKPGPVTLPEKFYIYKLDDEIMSSESTLSLEFLNWKSNYTNGFMSRSDTYKLSHVFFAPEKFYFKSRENFELDFNENFLLKHNFVYDDDRSFANDEWLSVAKNTDKTWNWAKGRTSTSFIWGGWPAPQYMNILDKNLFQPGLESLPMGFCYHRSDNCKIDFKIVKKHGFHQFESDFPDDANKLAVLNEEWKAQIKGKKIWPINSHFLSFCYHNRNNKYLQ